MNARIGALDYTRVATIYDSYVRFEADVPFFVGAAASPRGRVLELMAGTGRVSLPLLDAGIPLTCIDASVAMLAVLRQRARARRLVAEVCCGDVRELPLATRFRLAILPFQGFSELLTEVDQRQALRSVHRVLEPGGRFICTLHNPPVRLQSVTGAWVTAARLPSADGRGETVVSLKTDFDAERGVVSGVQRIDRYDAKGVIVGSVTVPLAFSLAGQAAFLRLVAEAGFGVVSLVGSYDGLPFRAETSPQMIWTLERLPGRG